MNGFARAGLILLIWLTAGAGSARSAEPAVSTCRDVEASLAVIGKERADLQSRLATFESVADDTFPAEAAIGDLLPGLSQQAPPARVSQEWPARTGCEELQKEYQSARDDLLWLSQRVAVHETAWSGRPDALEGALESVWQSRQRLQVAYLALRDALASPDVTGEAELLSAVEATQNMLRSIRRAFFRLVPGIGQNPTEHDIADLLALWQRSFTVEPGREISVPKDLPLPLQQQLAHYLQLAQLDVSALKEALNGMRAWVWQYHRPQFDLAQASDHLTDGRLLALESKAVGNHLAMWNGEIKLAHGESGHSLLRTAMEVSEYLAGLLAFPLLAFIAYRLGIAAATVQSRIAGGSRRRRLALQFSRFTAGLQLLLPWIVGLLGLALLERIFERLELPVLVPLARLARLYIVYGLLSLGGEWLQQRVAQLAGVYLSEDQIRATSRQARIAAGLIVLPWLLQELVDLAIGHSLLLEICRWMTVVTFLLALGVLLRSRREEFIAALKSMLPEPLDPWVDRLLGRGLLFVFTAPFTAPVLLLGLLASFLHKALIDFDWYRKLFARSFKLRAATAELETGEQEPGSGSDALECYRRWFLADDTEVDTPYIDTGLLAAVRNRMNPWLADRTEENVLLLTGDRGAGKSRTLGRLQRQLAEEQPDILVRRIGIPAKTLSAEATLSLIGQALKTDLQTGPAALVKSDEQRKPTVVILDNAQNLFLRRVGGFEGWETLLALTNTRLRNIFWLVVINRQSWAYLSNAYGGDYQFRSVVIAKPFSQNDIRSLVLSRNHLSRFRLRYDDILIATRGPEAGNIRNAEQLYFSLLWDASMGNPQLALHLWLTSVRLEGQQVVIGLPVTVPAASLEQLGNDLHFVYAAIVIHENLTSEELVAATALPENVVRSALKTAFDGGFVERSERRRYRILPTWYPVVTRLLARKNLLHG